MKINNKELSDKCKIHLGKATTNWIIKISKHDVQTIAFLCIFCKKCCKSDIAIGLVLQYNCNHKKYKYQFWSLIGNCFQT